MEENGSGQIAQNGTTPNRTDGTPSSQLSATDLSTSNHVIMLLFLFHFCWVRSELNFGMYSPVSPTRMHFLAELTRQPSVTSMCWPMPLGCT